MVVSSKRRFLICCLVRVLMGGMIFGSVLIFCELYSKVCFGLFVLCFCDSPFADFFCLV